MRPVRQSALFRLALLALIWGSSFLWIKLADRGRRGVHPPPGAGSRGAMRMGRAGTSK
jgi:hypothetical protein